MLSVPREINAKYTKSSVRLVYFQIKTNKQKLEEAIEHYSTVSCHCIITVVVLVRTASYVVQFRVVASSCVYSACDICARVMEGE